MSTVVDTNVTIRLNAVTCCWKDCGVVFGLNSEHQARLRAKHTGFHCPNGHIQYYLAETEEERLRRDLSRQMETKDQYRKERDQALKKADYTARVATRRKNELKKVTARVAHGICPCCNRTFKQLAAHMRLKHPDHVAKVHLELKKEDHE